MFETLITIFFLLSSVMFIITLFKGKALHPMNFIFLFWLLPVYLSSLHLSYFQDAEWCDNMKITILLSFIFLYITPLAAYFLFKEKNYKIQSFKFNTKWIANLSYVLSFLYILFIFIENYLLTKNFFPFFYNFDIHTHSTPILSLITRNPVLIASILTFSYCINDKNRKIKRINIFLILLIIIIPICTRGARYDSILSLVTIITIIYFLKYKNRKEKIKFILNLFIITLIFLILVAYIGQLRSTNFNKYNISYARCIKYKYNPGPLEVFAIYYGEFPMSVENLNLFIENFDNSNIRHTYIIHSLDFLFRGIFNFDNLFGDSWDFEKRINNLRDYYTRAATVPTAFAKFYMDLGPFATITPFIFLCLAIYFYYKGFQNIKYYLLYAVTISPFVLIAFTNCITSRETFINIIFWYFLFSIKKIYL